MAAKYSKKKKSKKRSDTNRRGILFSCVAVIVIAIILFLGYQYLNDMQNGTILENVSVAGVDVGGMTQAEAIQAVNAVADNYTTTAMTVTVLDSQVTISPEISRAKLDVRAAVKVAYKYGHSGSASKKQEQQETAANHGYAVDLSKHLNLDAAAIKTVLDELGDKYSTTLSQSTYEITGTAPEQTLVVTLGVPEYGLDMEVLYQQVLDAYSANRFSVTGEIGVIKPEVVDLEGILAQFYVAPVDAYFDKETFEIVEGVDGYGFDLETAKQTLENAPYGSTVEIPITNIPPKVTSQSLTDSLYADQLATYTAKYDSDSDRNTNLRLACEAINGTVLYPGETFSYNKALGERTSQRGYKPGPSYYNGKEVDTIGGGICQVSSALYHCAMTADLEIVTRHNHGFVVTYMPLGMDAAVSWDTLDFRFKNTTDYPIRIDASSDGGSTTVSIMGTDNKDYYVKMEYEVLATYAYSTKYQTMTADNAEGYKNGEYIVQPHTGYTVQTYRCKYDKTTDELLSKEKEDASYYDKCDAVICQISNTSGGSQGIGNGGVSEDGALP